MAQRRAVVLLVAFVTASIISLRGAPSAPEWPQWALNPQHTSDIGVNGQSPNQILANIVYDPNVPREMSLNQNNLLVHYQVPLVDGTDVYMENKGGAYTNGSYATQTWSEDKYSWINGQLTTVWSFASDWTAPGSSNDFWEPVFHAALANGYLYAPGAGGTIFKVSKADGTVVSRINPFKTINPRIFAVSPLTVDGVGNIYYNALYVQASVPFYTTDAVDSWLIKVAPDDSLQMVSYTMLLAGQVPAASDLCYATFSTSQLPWPPSPTAVPPKTTCGLQRVAINIAPAIAPDGTIYSVTRAQFISRYGYMVAITPSLTLKWATSLRGPDSTEAFPNSYLDGGYFQDGCNDGTVAASTLPPDGQPDGCRQGARNGVDPAVNRFGGGRVLDDSSSTPTVAPDGSVFYGAYTRYNWAQGHLMHFSASGQLLNSFGFGWDSTVAVYPHDATYSLVIKNNHYSGLGSYCNDNTICPTDRNTANPASPEAYFVSQLDPSLNVEWSFQNTNTNSCTRNAHGSITCVSDHPNGFEWCVNAPVLDKSGNVFANSEDGNLYVIAQGGHITGRLFQQLALGAAYTPTSLGGDGKIYSQNAGRLFVAGK